MVCCVAIWNMLLNVPISGHTMNSAVKSCHVPAITMPAVMASDASIIGLRGPIRSIQRPTPTAVKALITPNDPASTPISAGEACRWAAYSITTSLDPLKDMWLAVDSRMWVCSGSIGPCAQ